MADALTRATRLRRVQMATFRLCALPSRRRIESTVGLSNRSRASSNRVSCIKIRISKIRVQRLAHEIGRTLPKNQENDASETRHVLISGKNTAYFADLEP